MNASRADAARRAEVRTAARAWRRAGAIDEAALGRIEAAYPEDRPHMAATWRVVVFVIVTVAANTLFFAIATLLHEESGAGPWLFFAACLAAATELLLRPTGIGENGSAAATSFWAVTYAVVGLGLALTGSRGEETITVALLSAALLFSAACWHWGFAAYGTFAAIALFLFAARVPAGRVLWIVAGAVLLVVASRVFERGALAPPHRTALAGAFVVAAAAVYAAVNRYGVDQRLIESLQERSASPAPPGALAAAASSMATAVFPLILIAWGLRRRKPLILDTGFVFLALSLATLRYYVHLAPLWVVLAGAGAALVVAALGLHRWLRRAPGEDRGGFTARPLFESRRSGLESVAVVAAFAPDAAPAQPREPGGFAPGGGRYGGGGAGGSF
jgi:MFS family permease